MQPGIDPHRHAERQGENSGAEAQLESRRHLFEDDLPDRPRLLIGEAESPPCRAADEAGELDNEGGVEPQFLAQPFAVGLRCVLPNHVVDRVADIVEQRKSDQRHGQHHQHRLQQALDDEGEH